MSPVGVEVYQKAIVPYSENQISRNEAFQTGQEPVRTFLWKQIERTVNTEMISLFTKYLSVAQKKADIKDTFFSDIVDNHVESLIQRSHGLLDKKVAKQLLKAQTADTVINYNYTDIAERLYQKHCPKKSPKIPNIYRLFLNKNATYTNLITIEYSRN